MIRLKQLREEFKYNQRQMAIELNVSKSTYNYWENGKIEIDFNNLINIANYFNVSIDYLLGQTNIRNYNTQPTPALSEREQALIDIYNNIQPLNQAKLLAYAEGLKSADKQSQQIY